MNRTLLLLSLFCCGNSFGQSWQKMADVPVDLAFPVVVELNGNIHVVGGGASSGASNLHLRYRPSLNVWDTLPPLPYAAQQPAGAVVLGKIHFFGGGYPNTGKPLDKHYYYDADSGRWFAAKLMPVATAIHKAVVLNNRIYVMSGQPNKTLCEYYDPLSDTWVQNTALPDANFWYGAITANSKNIYRFGGGGFGNPTAAAHRYDPVNDQWDGQPDLPVPLHAASAVALNDTLLFISGGYYSGMTYDKTYVYHTRRQLYYPSNSMPFGTNYHSMVLAQGCVYSVGGDNSSVSGAGVSMLRICNPEYKWSVSVASPISAKPYQVIKTSEGFEIRLSRGRFQTEGVKVYNSLGQELDLPVYPEASGEVKFRSSDFPPGFYWFRFPVEGNFYCEKWSVR